MAEQIGPTTRNQLARLSSVWKQGEHVLISGATGSGKTVLARHLYDLRVKKGGFVVVFICKLRPDKTVTDEYKGWTRWKKWKKHPAPHENRILLWPDTEKLTANQALGVQRKVFTEAIDGISKQGKWTVGIDEGLYMCDPEFLNMKHDVAMLHYMGRSSGVTMIDLTQRPSHLPLVLYSSASHAFVGRARESVDVKRLSELGGIESAKVRAGRMEAQGRHDFLWIPVSPDWESETLNIRH